jgi:hypothetical protein
LGLGEALALLPKALERRRALQKSGFWNAVSDREIFNRLSR